MNSLAQTTPTPPTETPSHAQLKRILANGRIEWYPNPLRACDPIPILDATLLTAAIQMEEAERAQLEHIATPKEVAAYLYGLSGHFYEADMPDALRDKRADDYVRGLSGFAGEVWQQVYDQVLDDESVRYFPKRAVLKRMLTDVTNKRRWELHKLQKLIETTTTKQAHSQPESARASASASLPNQTEALCTNSTPVP